MGDLAVGKKTAPRGQLAAAWKRFGMYTILLTAVVAWSGSFVAARALLYPHGAGDATLTPTLLATVRFVLASAIFVPILYWQHARVQPLRWTDLPTFLLLGQMSIAMFFWLEYTGIQLTNATIAAVIVQGLIPLTTLVISGIAIGERLKRDKVLAIVLGAVGVVVVMSQKELQFSMESGFLFGFACLVGTALCFAAYSTLVRGIGDRYSSLTTTGSMTIAGTLGLLLLSLVSEDWRTLAALSPLQWAVIVYLAVVCSVIAYFLYNYALVRIRASNAAVWIYLEVPMVMVMAAWTLGEAITPHTVGGGLVILVSLYLVQKP